MVIAQECFRQRGEMLFVERLGQFCAAVRTCFSRMYSNPERVIAVPRALRKTSVACPAERCASQARSAAAVSRHRGKARSRRPLPSTWILSAGSKARNIMRRRAVSLGRYLVDPKALARQEVLSPPLNNTQR